MANLWNHEEPVTDHGLKVPVWIEQNISPYEVASIVKGGCASGAYMPAVTYADALYTMSKHGDLVLDYIQDIYGELPKPKDDESWSGMACFYLSLAVETWALGTHDRLEEILGDSEAA